MNNTLMNTNNNIQNINNLNTQNYKNNKKFIAKMTDLKINHLDLGYYDA